MIEVLLQAERALSVGLLDRAESLYQQVAESDPRNSIAVVGLARVTLERGDDAGALTIARRALAVDPENAAAQRMVQRLEEVIGYRGEALPPAEAPAETAAAAAEPDPGPAEPDAADAPPEPIVPAPVAVDPPTHPPEPAASPRRRSWLDRLFRR
jgi:thioredoxin-like negative regulator of GroEL